MPTLLPANPMPLALYILSILMLVLDRSCILNLFGNEGKMLNIENMAVHIVHIALVLYF